MKFHFKNWINKIKFPFWSNYSQINHNPPRPPPAPLKSSLKSHVPIRTSQHIPISKPGRYPSPPSSPPQPPHRLSSTNFPLRPVSVDPNDLQLSELQFPPAPTELGRFRESITKNTLTETVVTRLTTNQKGQRPVITEVFLFLQLPFSCLAKRFVNSRIEKVK